MQIWRPSLDLNQDATLMPQRLRYLPPPGHQIPLHPPPRRTNSKLRFGKYLLTPAADARANKTETIFGALNPNCKCHLPLIRCARN